jgi:hypothetical protein
VPLRVSPLKLAAPFEPVVAVALLGVAPAGVAVAATTTPLWLTGLPLASWSCSTGCCAKAVPVGALLDGGVVITSFVAAPAVPVAVNVTGLPVSVPEVAVRVFEPAVVPSVQLPTVAIPLASVVWLPPVTLPPPVATANVTATPATGLLCASCTSTEGGVPTAVPTVADCVVEPLLAIDAAAPAVPVAVNVSGLPMRASAVASRVFVPAVVPSVQEVTRATPFAFVLIAVVGTTVPPPETTANVTGTPATGLLN